MNCGKAEEGPVTKWEQGRRSFFPPPTGDPVFVRTVVLVLSATVFVLVLVLEMSVKAEPTFDHERLDLHRLSIDYLAFSYQIDEVRAVEAKRLTADGYAPVLN